MEHKGIDEMIAADHAVTYKTIETTRLDTAAMKKGFDPYVLEGVHAPLKDEALFGEVILLA